MKAMKHISQDRKSRSLESYPGPSEYNTGVLHTQQCNSENS